MPKGGYRPGAGRPKGAVKLPGAPASASTGTPPMEPLAYLLAVMNDEAWPVEVRLRATGMALPYTHTRPAPPSAKDKRQATAEAATGTGWDDLLLSPAELYAPRKVRGFRGDGGNQKGV